VADELAAVHQYMYFHFHLDDQGFAPLAKLFKRTAIAEMGHVEALAERILFLKGDVPMKAAAPVEAKLRPGNERFRPTLKDGKPVAVMTTVEVSFRLF
jgi:bacterioferritin (cytochrome b1)